MLLGASPTDKQAGGGVHWDIEGHDVQVSWREHGKLAHLASHPLFCRAEDTASHTGVSPFELLCG